MGSDEVGPGAVSADVALDEETEAGALGLSVPHLASRACTPQKNSLNVKVILRFRLPPKKAHFVYVPFFGFQILL